MRVRRRGDEIYFCAEGRERWVGRKPRRGEDRGVMQGREEESQGARDVSVVGTEESRSGGETRVEREDLPLTRK